MNFDEIIVRTRDWSNRLASRKPDPGDFEWPCRMGVHPQLVDKLMDIRDRLVWARAHEHPEPNAWTWIHKRLSDAVRNRLVRMTDIEADFPERSREGWTIPDNRRRFYRDRARLDDDERQAAERLTPPAVEAILRGFGL